MKQLSAISAVALTTLTFTTAWGLPSQSNSLTVALVWLLFMALAALPLAFVEAAIVRRTLSLPLQGLAVITRDADAPPFWRILAPLSMLVMMAMIAFAANYSTHGLTLEGQNAINAQAFPYLLVFLAIGFAWVGMKRLLPFLVVLIPAVLVLNALSVGRIGSLALLTPEQWQQVATAAILANLSTLGVYAWLNLQRLTDDRASKVVLPLWLTQTVVGIACIVVGVGKGNVSVVAYMLTTVFACAVLAEIVGRQLQDRKIAKPIAIGSVMVATVALTVAAEFVVFDTVLKVVSLLVVMGLSILVGWVMKISHARKSLNFSNEGIYNFWRVGVRIVAPVVIIWLLVGMFL